MRFLNELIRKTKAAHGDGRAATSGPAFNVHPTAGADGEHGEPDLPHLRRTSDFDHFAANTRPEPEHVTVGSSPDWDPIDTDGESEQAESGTSISRIGLDDSADDFVIRRPDAGALFALRASRDAEHARRDEEAVEGPGVADDPASAEAGQTEKNMEEATETAEVWQDGSTSEAADEMESSEQEDDLDFLSVAAEDVAPEPSTFPSAQLSHHEEETEGFAALRTDWTHPSENREEPATGGATRINIWDVESNGDEDDTFGEGDAEAFAAVDADILPVASESAPQQRRGGRVRTRLLGFHRPDELPADPIDRASRNGAAGGEPTFPVGWMVLEKGPGRGAFFPLFSGVSSIGRGEDQAVRLDFGDMSVSRDSHAVVAYDDEQRAFFVGHSGKANPVRLNGMPVLSTERFKDGDRIRIGETTLRFVALCGPDFDWGDEVECGELNVAAR